MNNLPPQIAQERLDMFVDAFTWHRNKPDEQRSHAENEWLKHAPQRIEELQIIVRS